MLDYITGIFQNAAYYLKTHRPFGTPIVKPVPNYENEPALDALIANYPTQIQMWLELQFQSTSARR